MLDFIHQKLATQKTIKINVYVTPKSQRNQFIECFEQLDGQIMVKVKIRGIPENGQVNLELIEYLSDQLNIAKSTIQITHGLTSRHKILKIST